jgi:hypothetical protein
MIVMKTEVDVNGISGKDVYDFMLHCTDNDYQKWWPGTHLAFHTIKRCANNAGNLVYFDEYVGNRRLKFNAIVTELVPNKRLVWQMETILRLPAWLSIDIEDSKIGVKIIHTLAIGFRGIGRIFDSILRMYFSSKFQYELEEHAQIEFHKLADLLS